MPSSKGAWTSALQRVWRYRETPGGVSSMDGTQGGWNNRTKITKHSLQQGRRMSWYIGTSLNPQNKQNFDASDHDSCFPFADKNEAESLSDLPKTSACSKSGSGDHTLDL